MFSCATLSEKTEETYLELALCKLLDQTPNYFIYQLQMQSNCISQVKMFEDDVFCLRNHDNKVYLKKIKLNFSRFFIEYK